MTMERWLGVCRYLTSQEMVRLSQCSRDLRADVESVAELLARDAPSLAFLFQGSATGAPARIPRISLFMWLRCLELTQVKALLLLATPVSDSPPDADPALDGLAWTSAQHVTVVVSKAFVLSCKRQCDRADKLLLQGPKAVARLADLPAAGTPMTKKQAKASKLVWADIVAMHRLDEREVASMTDTITCAHDNLLPLALAKGPGKRMNLPLSAWKKLARYVAPDRVFGAGRDATECGVCLTNAKLAQLEAESKKTERLLLHTESSDTSLADLLGRKSGYPPKLLSPERGRFYLVPQSWLKRWRQFVKSVVDAPPGPILNGNLLCPRHRKPVVPTAVALFLMGASTSVLTSIPGITYAMYEIVTDVEWEQLQTSYCAEVAVGFDVVRGTVVWSTLPCQVCDEPTEAKPKKGGNRQGQSARRQAQHHAPMIRL